MAKVRKSSTRYLTSRKNKLAADRKMPRPAASITMTATSGNTINMLELSGTPRNANRTINTQDAITKSTN